VPDSSSATIVEPLSEVGVFGRVSSFSELYNFGSLGQKYFNFGWGEDNVSGGNSKEVLIGGMFDDILNGGGGNDLLLGGDGNDTYVFNSAVFDGPLASNGHDTIIDNSGALDKILLGAGATFRSISLSGTDIQIAYTTGVSSPFLEVIASSLPIRP